MTQKLPHNFQGEDFAIPETRGKAPTTRGIAGQERFEMGVNAQVGRHDKFVDIEHGCVFMKRLDSLIALALGDKTFSLKLVAHRVTKYTDLVAPGQMLGDPPKSPL